MSFENIQLPASLIQDLYKDLLIDETNMHRSADTLQNASISSLGSNKKNILVLVNDTEVPFLSDVDLNFLIGILQACKLSLADIALVNIATQKVTIQELNTQFNPLINILFSVQSSAVELPLNFPDYQVQQYNNQTYLCAPSLHNLTLNKQSKQWLWESLKKIFLAV